MKATLLGFHPACQSAIEAALGQDGATVGGYRTVVALKAQQVILIAQEAAKLAQEQSVTAKAEVNTLHEHRDALQSPVEALQAMLLTEMELHR